MKVLVWSLVATVFAAPAACGGTAPSPTRGEAGRTEPPTEIAVAPVPKVDPPEVADPAAEPAAAPAPASVAALADVPIAPPPGAVEAEAALVWVPDSALPHGVRTVWLSSAGPRATDPVWVSATREEPVVASGSRLMAIRAGTEHFAVCDCARCTDDACPKRPRTRMAIERPAVVDLRTGQQRLLLPGRDTDTCKGFVAEVNASFMLSSAVGSVVFLAENVGTSACVGAHPFWEDDTYAVDVGGDQPRRFEPAGPDIDALAPKAREQLLAEHEGCLLEPVGDAGYYATSLGWGAGGTPEAIHTFTLPAPYACGTGPGHYSVATSITTEVRPNERFPAGPLPAWLVATLGKDAPLGVSPIDAAADRASMLKRFRAAPIPARPMSE